MKISSCLRKRIRREYETTYYYLQLCNRQQPVSHNISYTTYLGMNQRRARRKVRLLEHNNLFDIN